MIAIEARNVSRAFGAKIALQQVSLEVKPGEIHALLGPNGAGKTTLLRILAGLTDATSGQVRILEREFGGDDRNLRRLIGLVPAGDRTFYYRLSGEENLSFFGRLHGLSGQQSVARAHKLMAQMGLADSYKLPVGKYSHGMQRRLAIARALIVAPPVLLMDEATHDLDPDGARQVRDLAGRTADEGTAIVWATQRIDEIRGFAGGVTLLAAGQVRFAGSVPQLMAHSGAIRFVLRMTSGRASRESLEVVAGRALGTLGRIANVQEDDAEHYTLCLADGVVLGNALAKLTEAGVRVHSCREERSEVEEAFLWLTREGDA